MSSKAVAKTEKVAGLGDAAVRAKTGRTWAEWLAVLDAEGAATMGHKEIVAVLAGTYGVPPWWQQMVAVGYEQERGLRRKHEKTDGFSVSVSRTLAAPLAVVYKAFADKRSRAKWLAGHDAVVRKATPDRSVRMTWSDGASSVEVMFYPKGDAKTQVQVQHNKLARERDVERMRAFWAEALDRLKTTL